MLAQYGVGRDGLPGAVAGRATTTPAARTPRPGRRRSPACRQRRRPGWRASSPATPSDSEGRVDDPAWAPGTNHWFHSDQIYRAFLALTMLSGCQGVNGGGWAHYVGPGEGPAAHRAASTWPSRLDWQRPPRHMIQTAVLLPAHRPVALRDASAPTSCATARQRAVRRARRVDGPARAVGADGLDAVATRRSTATRSTWPTRPSAAGHGAGRVTSSTQLKAGRLHFAGEDPDAPGELPAGDDRLAGQPARLLGQGQRVLPAGTCSASTTRSRAHEAPPEQRPREVALARARRRRASSTC